MDCVDLQGSTAYFPLQMYTYRKFIIICVNICVIMFFKWYEAVIFLQLQNHYFCVVQGDWMWNWCYLHNYKKLCIIYTVSGGSIQYFSTLQADLNFHKYIT